MVKHYLLIFIVVFISTFSILSFIKPKFVMKKQSNSKTEEISTLTILLVSFAIGLLSTTKFFLLLVILPGVPPF